MTFDSTARGTGGPGQSFGPSTQPLSDAEILDVPQVARWLRVNRNHVYALVAQNTIPHCRIGRFVRFHRPALVRWFDSWSLQGTQKGH